MGHMQSSSFTVAEHGAAVEAVWALGGFVRRDSDTQVTVMADVDTMPKITEALTRPQETVVNESDESE